MRETGVGPRRVDPNWVSRVDWGGSHVSESKVVGKNGIRPREMGTRGGPGGEGWGRWEAPMGLAL